MENETQFQEEVQVEQKSSLQQATPLSKYLAMALFIITPFVGGYIGYMYAPEKMVEVEKVVEVERETSIETDTATSLSDRGINIEKVSIRYVPVESIWEVDGFLYQVETVYLVPDIANIGNWRNNFSVPEENQFVVVEGTVRNRMTSGQKEKADISNYLRLRAGEEQLVPVSADDDMLSPQQDDRFQVLFVVSNDTEVVELYSGIQSQPRVTPINFYGEEVEEFFGVFQRSEGLSERYIE